MRKRQRQQRKQAAQAHQARQAERKAAALDTAERSGNVNKAMEKQGYVPNGRGGWRPLHHTPRPSVDK